MKVFHISTLLLLLSFLDMHASMNTELNHNSRDATVRINSEEVTFSFPSTEIFVLDLLIQRTIDEAVVTSSPIRQGGLRCFFYSPSRGEISEIFHEFLPLSSGFQDAEYMNCFGILEDEESLVFLEQANRIPILSKSATRKRGLWNMMDIGSMRIRGAALIDPAYDVVKCEFVFTDNVVGSVDKVGHLVDMFGTVEGLACRKKWTFAEMVPFRRGGQS